MVHTGLVRQPGVSLSGEQIIELEVVESSTGGIVPICGDHHSIDPGPEGGGKSGHGSQEV